MLNRSGASGGSPLSQSGGARAPGPGSTEFDSAASAAQASLPGGVDHRLALRAAGANCTILLTGETGVGKGFLARWIHEHSPRAEKPFIPVNCGAIPDTLIDSQLFGHARGAFSGATSDHLGLIRAAQGGTLLLDEVGALPASAQHRLLRLLQDREVQPIGHAKPVVVDVRVIAATNTDLAAAVERKEFREDLLFRLDVVQFRIKPLRERREEIPALIAAFNAEFAQMYRQDELVFDDAAMGMLLRSAWPGNVRQLRSLLERLHVLCHGQRITASHISETGRVGEAVIANVSADLDQIKREHLQRVLEESGGSIARAAEVFGVHRSTIYRWLRYQGPSG